MKFRVLRVAVGLLFVLTSAEVIAHHNMSAIFDFNQRFTVTGPLTKLDWRNPHIELLVEGKNERGEIQTWRFEGPAPVVFARLNADKSKFQSALGKELKVEASRARDGSLWGLIRNITMPDGTIVSLCPDNC